MKNNKLFAVIVFVVVIINLFSIESFAENEETGDYFSEDSGAYTLIENLDDETRDILSSLGIDEVDFEQIYQVSPQRIITVFLNILKGKIFSPLKLLLIIIVIEIFQSVCESAVSEKNKQIFNAVFTLLILTAAVVPVINLISDACSNILLTNEFMISFIPVYAVLLSSTGNFTQAINFNTALFSASQFIVSFVKTYLLPLMSVYLCINIASVINPVVKLKNTSSVIKKTVTVILSCASVIFIGFLSVKGSIASNIDAVAIRGIRTVTGAFIPYIGSSLADAYASLAGSLSLINKSVGFLGIIIIFIMNIPIISELFLYYLSLHIGYIVGDMLGNENSKSLDLLADVLSLINIIVIFTMVVFIVSIGIVIKAKAG